MNSTIQLQRLKSFFTNVLLPTIASVAFSLVSFPELITSLFLNFGVTFEEEDGVFSDVRTLAIVIGTLATLGSIVFARHEAGVLQRVNAALQHKEVELTRKNECLARRDVEWDRFRESAFNGLKEVLDAYLRNFCIKHYCSQPEIGSPPPSLRISIYTYDRMRDICYLVGRFSATESFNRAGRRKYPIDTGAIGRAWDTGSADIILENDWSCDPLEWARELETEYNMGREVIAGLTMKSRAFCARRINGGPDGNTPIGVALIETTDCALDDVARELLAKLLDDHLKIIRTFIYHDYELHKKYPRNGEGL